MMAMPTNKMMAITNKITKQPCAYWLTNQNSEAKQTSGDRRKSATKKLDSSSIPMMTRHIVTAHFPLGGKGFLRSPRSMTSAPKTSCMYGTMNTAAREG